MSKDADEPEHIDDAPIDPEKEQARWRDEQYQKMQDPNADCDVTSMQIDPEQRMKDKSQPLDGIDPKSSVLTESSSSLHRPLEPDPCSTDKPLVDPKPKSDSNRFEQNPTKQE